MAPPKKQKSRAPQPQEESTSQPVADATAVKKQVAVAKRGHRGGGGGGVQRVRWLLGLLAIGCLCVSLIFTWMEQQKKQKPTPVADAKIRVTKEPTFTTETRTTTTQPKPTIATVRQAAEDGDAHSMHILGTLYTGTPVDSLPPLEQDDEQAFEWWLKAAEQGYQQCQHMVAHSYLNGRGVYKSTKKAVEWFHKASENLQPGGIQAESQVALGVLYMQGNGVPENAKEARAWFVKAAKQGHKGAKQMIGELNKQLKESGAPSHTEL
eukprot:gnl/TRDRNA2_/TRDRNA2_42997_c0_seq1.p1 gnl/TRDRNA2_/TRDRNA2_42997_c0~~gnl/TRDRNA2_/TRDRNA2_42997_c0_seq1.p1  ORF type:complete len:306 (-),score=62.25 gnl/TRDRNA2_/TRDRNA2_42997_c0_seq1:101-898(-)